MAKPQLENGHTRIANEILEYLMKMHLSSNQWQVLLCIFRKTYGFQKKVDYIANKQIGEATGLGKTVVSRVLHNLNDMHLITRNGKHLGFQKDWERWQGLSVQLPLDTKLAKQSTSEPEGPSKKVFGKDTRASQSNKVAAWQAMVFHRDGLICQICGRELGVTLSPAERDLNAHHIFPWADYPDLRFDVNNGLTMCDECHYCYHYADERNTYEYINQVFEFKKLAGELTIEKLAILYQKGSNLVERLAKQSIKVSSPVVAQKKKETITKETIQKKRYGQFKNVSLADEEYQKLKDRFGSKVSDMIETLSEGIESHNYKYSSHYATILAWERRDRKREKVGVSRGSLSNTEELKEGWKKK